MTEPDRRPARELDAEELVWPPPVSADDIVWLDPVTAPPPLDSPKKAWDTAPAAAVKDRPESASEAAHAPATLEHAGALPLSYCLFPEVAFEWHDAVAIVQQLAEQLTRGIRGVPTGSLPDISNITIDASGGLSATLEPTGIEPLARGLGYLLHRLLTDRQGPVALRLIVSQAVSDLPTIASVEDLTRELTRWERPHRTEKLQHVYERLHAVAGTRHRASAAALEIVDSRPETAKPEPPLMEPATLSVADVAREARVWLQSHRMATVSAVAAAFIVFVVGVGLGTLTDSERPAVPPPAVAPTVAESVAPPTDYWLPGRLNFARATGGSVSSPTQSVQTPARQRSSDLAVAGFVAQSPREEPAPGAAQQTVPQAPRPGPAPTSAGFATDLPEHIYTSGDPGVVEAVLVKPYLPEHPEPGTPPESLGVLELVVNRAGAVESVRLHSPFNRYRERWWVYVAKNWTFRPAFKDGQPVRSLKRIIITDVRLTDPQ